MHTPGTYENFFYPKIKKYLFIFLPFQINWCLFLSRTLIPMNRYKQSKKLDRYIIV